MIVLLVVFYKNGRSLTRHDDDTAMAHARSVVDFERRFGVFTEGALQRLLMHSRGIVELLNRYYASVHFPLTALFFAWMLIWHPYRYRAIRTWFVIVTALGLVIHIAYPLAPPRMLGDFGFIDTLQQFGPRIYTTDTNRSVANQFAAMPSLHFGWALMVAVGFIVIRRTQLSLIALVHPFLTLIAIVATANHYWLDAAVAGVLVAGSAAVLILLSQRSRVETGGQPAEEAAAAGDDVELMPAYAMASSGDQSERVVENTATQLTAQRIFERLTRTGEIRSLQCIDLVPDPGDGFEHVDDSPFVRADALHRRQQFVDGGVSRADVDDVVVGVLDVVGVPGQHFDFPPVIAVSHRDRSDAGQDLVANIDLGPVVGAQFVPVAIDVTARAIAVGVGDDRLHSLPRDRSDSTGVPSQPASRRAQYSVRSRIEIGPGPVP